MFRSKVLLPSDGSDASLKAAAYAARLMKLNPEMKVSVLVVVPQSSIFGGAAEGEKEYLAKLEGKLETKAEEVLEGTVRVFTDEGLSVEGIIEKGDPAGVIVELSQRGDYDHIIMGSRGVSELKGMALGSVSHKVIHLAKVRVTLVK